MTMTLPSRRSLILGAGAAIITRRAVALPPAPTSLRNPLAYPGGNPGVNYNHIAFSGGAPSTLVFSGVAVPGGSFIRLDKPTLATYSSITPVIDGRIGPAFKSVAGSADNINFSGLNATLPTAAQGLTLSGIFNYDVGSSRVDLQACKLEYSIVSPK